MKSLLVLCLLCATAYAFPVRANYYPSVSAKAASDEDSNESELIHPMTRKGMPSVVEVDVGDSDEDSFFFPSFFRPIFFNPFPRIKFGGFSDLFSTSSFGWNSFFNRVPDDAKVTNSTSTVKIVDGHKITMNATTYENEKNGAVYKYEVIEVTRLDKPGDEEGEKSTDETIKNEPEAAVTIKNESPEDTSSVKNDNNSLDNEIFKEELADGNWAYYREGSPATTESRSENYDPLGQDYIDISDDIRVNTMAEQAALDSPSFDVPADVELFANNNPNSHLSKYQDYYVPARDIYDYTYNIPQLRQQTPSSNNRDNYKADYDRFGYQAYINNFQYPYFNNVQYYDPQTRNNAQTPSPSPSPTHSYHGRPNDYY